MRILRVLAPVAVTYILVLALVDVALANFLTFAPRLAADFSARYLQLELAHLRAHPPRVLVVGDSTLWGYQVAANETAFARLAQAGCDCVNLSYEGGSAPNEYAMLRLIYASGVRPGYVIFNVNQKSFNPADSSYRTLYPAVDQASAGELTPSDRALLRPASALSIEATLEHFARDRWTLFALGPDLRERYFGDADIGHALHAWLERATGAAQRQAAAHPIRRTNFFGAYNLRRLNPRNVSMHFYIETLDLLAHERVPAIAIFTATNHTLLGPLIENPQYARNKALLVRLAREKGVRVIDFDHSFAGDEFVDNDHLDARGNADLARRLDFVRSL